MAFTFVTQYNSWELVELKQSYTACSVISVTGEIVFSD